MTGAAAPTYDAWITEPGLVALMKRWYVPAAGNTHVAAAAPVVLSAADAHTVDGAGSDALSDA